MTTLIGKHIIPLQYTRVVNQATGEWYDAKYMFAGNYGIMPDLTVTRDLNERILDFNNIIIDCQQIGYLPKIVRPEMVGFALPLCRYGHINTN
jgi:hypothetical protein